MNVIYICEQRLCCAFCVNQVEQKKYFFGVLEIKRKTQKRQYARNKAKENNKFETNVTIFFIRKKKRTKKC